MGVNKIWKRAQRIAPRRDKAARRAGPQTRYGSSIGARNDQIRREVEGGLCRSAVLAVLSSVHVILAVPSPQRRPGRAGAVLCWHHCDGAFLNATLGGCGAARSSDSGFHTSKVASEFLTLASTR